MHAPRLFAPDRSRLRAIAEPSLLLLAALTGACGGSSAGGGQSGIPGSEESRPDEDQDGLSDGLFFVDPNQSGGGSRLHIAPDAPAISPGLFWARLVDVHEIDALGEVVPEPVFRDFTIEEGIQTDGTSYRLERNPITQKTRLVILARKTGVADSSAFDALLAAASDDFPEISAKNDDGTSAPPFTFVPRNACLVIRFDDCLDNGPPPLDHENADPVVVDTVQVLTGYPPSTPYGARIVFDPNHGAVVGGRFRPTRALVDLTVSDLEASDPGLTSPPPVNALGLPPSLTTTDAANASIRIPTRIDLGSGQFAILTNVAGNGLNFEDDRIVDPTTPTADVVRAVRSGNSSDDPNNGFLMDLDRPQVVGTWQLTVVDAAPLDADGEEFELDVVFPTACRSAPQVGDVIAVSGEFLEVTQDGATPGAGGDVADLRVRSAAPVDDPAALLGNGLFLSPFDPALSVATACWVSFIPQPTAPPATGVSTNAQVFVRFSEPMDPDALSPFQQFLVVKGAATVGTSTANTKNIIVGEARPSNDLEAFAFTPLLSFPHTQGTSETLHVELSGPTDLAGNTLGNELPFFNFTLSSPEESEANGSVVLRFGSNDEVGPDTFPDLRGQFFYDFSRGVILPRAVAVTGWPADRTNPVPALMTALPGGVFVPLNPLGAKLQTVWRYCDVGWDVKDETKYNLDVIGLDWSPLGGQIVADFFENFEVRLGHSRFLPDETIAAGPPPAPKYPRSGLQGSPNLFEDNFLSDPVGAPQVIHNRALGYTVNPADLFLTPTGTPMIPYPLNRGSGLDLTYTWRDTAVLGKGAPTPHPGIPLEIEEIAGVVPVGQKGTVATAGNVPSLGLPLLIELRCFPSDTGVGLNVFDVSLSNLVSTAPNFRAFSAGGVDQTGRLVVKNPDLEPVPTGGYNPFSVPPGAKTRTDADNLFYLGQLDVVVRVSRVHTIWLDSGDTAPTYMDPVLVPSDDAQPEGTAVVLDYRAATGFSASSNNPIDATKMNAFGDITSPTVNFLNALNTWSSDISLMSGGRHLQVRISFLNSLQTGLSPELSALAIPFLTD